MSGRSQRQRAIRLVREAFAREIRADEQARASENSGQSERDPGGDRQCWVCQIGCHRECGGGCIANATEQCHRHDFRGYA